jgi:hypothetical protein
MDLQTDIVGGSLAIATVFVVVLTALWATGQIF